MGAASSPGTPNTPKQEPRWTATPKARDLALTFAIAVVLAAIVAGIVFYNAVNSPSVAPAPTSNANERQTPVTLPGQATPTATLTMAAYKESCKAVSVATIASAPSGYLGASVTFQATVTGFFHNSNGQIAGMNVADPNDPSAIIQVNYTPGVATDQIHVGDSVTVWGQGTSPLSSVNGPGQTLSEGAVNELYLNDPTSGYDDLSVTDPQGYINGGG